MVTEAVSQEKTLKNVVTPSGKVIINEIPTLHEEQIIPITSGTGRYVRGFDVTQPFIIGISGPRGSGKSQTLSYLGIRALTLGLRCWLDYPLQFYLIRRGKEYKDRELLKSEQLDMVKLMTMNEDINGGFVGIDEYRRFASAYGFNSTQNQLLNEVWGQIRKNNISFGFVSKKIAWIDPMTRDETDIEIACQDAHMTSDGYHKYAEGEMIYWQVKDISGLWTGKMYEDHPIDHPAKLFAKPFWGSYNTNQHFDIFAAKAGVKLDLKKTIISDKEDGPPLDMDKLGPQLRKDFDRNEVIQCTYLYMKYDIRTPQEKAIVANWLADNGIKQRFSQGQRSFVATEEAYMN